MDDLTKPASFYETNGYFIHASSVLPAEVVQAARVGMDEVREGRYDKGYPPSESPWNPGDDRGTLCKIENPQRANEAIADAISHPLLGQAVAEIVGADWIQVWWVQLLYKPPATNASKPVVGWHRDRTYWGPWTPDSDLFTIWLAISDVGPYSGPMMFVPGSHEWDTEAGGDFFNSDPDSQKSSIPVPAGRTWQEIPATMDAGGFSIHHNKTYHASGPNHASHPRRSFAIHARSANSQPVGNERSGLTEFIDNLDICPVIYGG